MDAPPRQTRPPHLIISTEHHACRVAVVSQFEWRKNEDTSRGSPPRNGSPDHDDLPNAPPRRTNALTHRRRPPQGWAIQVAGTPHPAAGKNPDGTREQSRGRAR